MTLIEFLNARLDDDEAAARAVVDAGGESDWKAHPIAELDGRHNPARVLREIAAKRAVLDLHTWTASLDGCWSCSGDHGADPTPAPCGTLRHMAAVHADHPDYRQEWAP